MPYALADLKQFKAGKSSLVFHDDYDNALIVKNELSELRNQLSGRQLELFDKLVAQKSVFEYDDFMRLYNDIYTVWEKVCFPDDRCQLKTVSPVMLGGELRRRRMEKNIPTKHAAEIVGIDEFTLYDYEEGRHYMRVDVFFRLCQVYKADPTEVLNKIAHGFRGNTYHKKMSPPKRAR